MMNKQISPVVILETWSMKDLAHANAVIDIEQAIQEDQHNDRG